MAAREKMQFTCLKKLRIIADFSVESLKARRVLSHSNKNNIILAPNRHVDQWNKVKEKPTNAIISSIYYLTNIPKT